MNRGRTSICHLSHQMKVSLGTTCHAILHNAILHRNWVQELLLLICHNVYSSVNESLILFARLYSIWLFTTSVSKMVSSVYSLLTINSMVSNFWCSRTVSKVYSKLIDYYNNFYVDGSWRQDVGALSGNS
jgi:hypothetical protein